MLPKLANGEQVTEDEFITGIADCVAIRQRRSPKGMNLTQEEIEVLRSKYL